MAMEGRSSAGIADSAAVEENFENSDPANEDGVFQKIMLETGMLIFTFFFRYNCSAS